MSVRILPTQRLQERHLRRLLKQYVLRHEDRTHLGLGKDAPTRSRAAALSAGAHVTSLPRLGGLHHCYTRGRINSPGFQTCWLFTYSQADSRVSLGWQVLRWLR